MWHKVLVGFRTTWHSKVFVFIDVYIYITSHMTSNVHVPHHFSPSSPYLIPFFVPTTLGNKHGREALKFLQR